MTAFAEYLGMEWTLKDHLVPNFFPLVSDTEGHTICCTHYFRFYLKLTPGSKHTS